MMFMPVELQEMASGSIIRCYNIGSVAAVRDSTGMASYYVAAGGILGNGKTVAVENCYNTGEISATNNGGNYEVSGGIMGEFYPDVSISCCYNMGKPQAWQ